MDERGKSARDELIRAVEGALAGRWDEAHETAQRHEGDAAADWLHAVLHKIEGDAANSRYWYRRAARTYEDFSDTAAELRAIRVHLGG